MIPLVNQARDLGLKQGIYSYFMPGEKQFRDATGKNAEGIIYLDTPDIKETSASYRAFMRRYLKAYPQGPLVEFFIRTTHDALKAITDGINQVGPDATAVKEFLKTYTFEGALGHVAFDESGDVVDLNFVIKQIKNGEPQALE
jgi:ABC-type branched-subunit amino acid transport system substrate-binding protein